MSGIIIKPASECCPIVVGLEDVASVKANVTMKALYMNTECHFVKICVPSHLIPKNFDNRAVTRALRCYLVCRFSTIS